MNKILIIDDDIVTCSMLEKFLTRKGYKTFYVTSGKKGLDYLKENKTELVICDYRLPDMNGKDVLINIKEHFQNISVIIITGYPDVKTAIDLIKMGAYEYITKPILPEELTEHIEKALEHKTKIDNHIVNEEKTTDFKNFKEDTVLNFEKEENKNIAKGFVIGNSREAEKLHGQIKLVAPTNYSVIIYGESGTGKESVAYTIHALSPRREKPFVAVDCGSLTKELAGSELFGHEKGSFTGALQSKIGQFELANGGTIFLDEIVNLTYDIQVSLLRVIQERKIRKIGSQKETNIDVRIIVASNEKIFEATTKGKFREDLYHRFNEFSINLPPLRERNQDIMIFANYFLEKANLELDKNINGFNSEVENIFLTYNWPGNLREMNNIIKRAALMADKNIITPETLPQELVFQSKFASPNENSSVLKNMPELKSAALMAEYEKILEILRKVNFNKSKAAILLQIDRKTLYNKMKHFNLLQSVAAEE